LDWELHRSSNCSDPALTLSVVPGVENGSTNVANVDLAFPSGLAIAQDGKLYVSTIASLQITTTGYLVPSSEVPANA
jgi:hypothetical protein